MIHKESGRTASRIIIFLTDLTALFVSYSKNSPKVPLYLKLVSGSKINKESGRTERGIIMILTELAALFV